MIKKIKYQLFKLVANKLDGRNSAKGRLVKLRLYLIGHLFESIGSNVNLQSGLFLVGINNITIGNNSGIGRNCYIFANDKVVIGANVMIAPEVIIHTSNHGLAKEMPMIEQASTTKSIVIEDDVWIASRVTILSGVKVAKGCVLAAGSVVNKSTEPYSIYGGVPAKKIGERV
jgi:maltose O-acetyltransferase